MWQITVIIDQHLSLVSTVLICVVARWTHMFVIGHNTLCSWARLWVLGFWCGWILYVDASMCYTTKNVLRWYIELHVAFAYILKSVCIVRASRVDISLSLITSFLSFLKVEQEHRQSHRVHHRTSTNRPFIRPQTWSQDALTIISVARVLRVFAIQCAVVHSGCKNIWSYIIFHLSHQLPEHHATAIVLFKQRLLDVRILRDCR